MKYYANCLLCFSTACSFLELGVILNTKFTLCLPIVVYNVISVKQVSFKFDVQNNLFEKKLFF